MAKNQPRWQKINTFYVGLMGLSSVFWLLQWHTFGFCISIVGAGIAFFIYQRRRWAYFFAAALFFGLLRVAMDDGYNFYQDWQSAGKLIYLVMLILAIVLHEKAAINDKPSEADDMPH